MEDTEPLKVDPAADAVPKISPHQFRSLDRFLSVVRLGTSRMILCPHRTSGLIGLLTDMIRLAVLTE